MPVKIAILYPTAVPWMARFQDGVRHYAKSHGNWHIFGSPPSLTSAGESALTLRSLKGWKGDGIIISSNDMEELRYARSLSIPVINLGGGLEKTYGVPRIMVDHYKAGRMAARHLIERGLTSLAFYGWENQWYSTQRFLGFQAEAAEAGIQCESLLRPINEDADLIWTKRINILVDWLSSLPVPSGVFAVHDYRAQLLLEACREAQLRVPDDIAVIGMDNDETICNHSAPTLTSITRNSMQVGLLASALLDRMIHGETHPEQEVLIAPTEVVVRESSEMMYCSNPLVRQALEYMMGHLDQSFNIALVADQIGVSKRKLEMQFSESLNSSPHQYLVKMRINHAKALIKRDPKKTIDVIARECGFGSNPSFFVAFQRLTGTTPSSYRSQYLNKNKVLH
jgi:LacI family transcriptional regulator